MDPHTPDSSSPTSHTGAGPEPPPPSSSAAARSPLASNPDSLSVVATDAYCAACGYNLRSLPLDGNCPECGEAVAYSVFGFYLSASPPAWRRDLARGLLILWLVPPLALVAYLLTMGAAALAALLAGASLDDLWVRQASLVFDVLYGAATLALLVYALRLLTRPEPAADRGSQPASRRRSETATARRVLRIAAPWLFLGLLPHLLQLIAMILAPLGYIGAGFLITAGATGSILSGTPGFVCWLALLRHIRRLLQRIPHPGLVRFAGIEFWGSLVWGVLSAATLALAFLWLVPFFAGLPPWTPPATAPVLGSTSATSTAPAATTGLAMSRQITITTPGGATITTTTLPATFPSGARLPYRALGFVAVSSGLAGCGTLILGIAGYVLLILAWRAIRAVPPAPVPLQPAFGCVVRPGA